ncbi:hypothetical protein BJ165DRAFT_1448720 [Panaeolus papilionaceus]|nr:hypothetical protein BJ165DRAFT_1448720 [Panaeolus papilionaceus]
MLFMLSMIRFLVVTGFSRDTRKSLNRSSCGSKLNSMACASLLTLRGTVTEIGNLLALSRSVVAYTSNGRLISVHN